MSLSLLSNPEQPSSPGAVDGEDTPKQALLCQGAKGPLISAPLPPAIAASETSPGMSWHRKVASESISALGGLGCFLPHGRRGGSSLAAPVVMGGPILWKTLR